MIIDIVKIIIMVTIAAIGWIVAHYFTSRRDIRSKRRDLSTEYLIQAYRTLTNDVSHRESTNENRVALEETLSDIQLFGSEEQISMAHKLADDVANGGSFELDPLINSLRMDLRKQLALPPVKGNVKWLRFSGHP
ncbi:hypothetical protein [Dongshaea marina]|uniref:hypothetical protein n=1 Tax=Dongshaea marina TaxID=2047966 RepID=UPI000D3EA579|nr:hypothetical protein [Dongshaea marina]